MERISRSKAIRLKCLDCCAGQAAEVRRCPATNCSLWRYRMGKEIKDLSEGTEQENDELKPIRKNIEKSADFEDEDLDCI